MPLSSQLSEYIAACFTGLWVQSHEHEDALAEIAQLCRDENWRLATWDISQGLQISGQTPDQDAGGADPLAAIRSINSLAGPDSSAILVLRNFHRFFGTGVDDLTYGNRKTRFSTINRRKIAVGNLTNWPCIAAALGAPHGEYDLDFE